MISVFSLTLVCFAVMPWGTSLVLLANRSQTLLHGFVSRLLLPISDIVAVNMLVAVEPRHAFRLRRVRAVRLYQ